MVVSAPGFAKSVVRAASRPRNLRVGLQGSRSWSSHRGSGCRRGPFAGIMDPQAPAPWREGSCRKATATRQAQCRAPVVPPPSEILARCRFARGVAGSRWSPPATLTLRVTVLRIIVLRGRSSSSSLRAPLRKERAMLEDAAPRRHSVSTPRGKMRCTAGDAFTISFPYSVSDDITDLNSSVFIYAIACLSS